MSREIIDYIVVSGEVQSDYNQTKFNAAVLEKIKHGYVPYGELKTEEGRPGGFLTLGQSARLSQAMVLYEKNTNT